jgi:erythromycin esterase
MSELGFTTPVALDRLAALIGDAKFAEGELADAWLRGGPGEAADIGRDGLTFSLGDSEEMPEMLTWLRTREVRYAGLDVPASAGSPLPALRAVREFAEMADPAAVALVDQAIGALRVDTYLREVDAMMNGRGTALNASSRDEYMASTVRLLREIHGPDARIVLMLHNGHLQRIPFQAMPTMAISSTGSHPAGAFGTTTSRWA